MDRRIEEIDQSVLDVTLKAIMKACREPSSAIRLSALAMVFELLGELAKAKNPQSPSLYKLLTFSFIENFHALETREFMSLSFIDLFESHRSIPVAILLDPFLRKLQQDQMERELNPDHQGLLHFDLKLLRCFI